MNATRRGKQFTRGRNVLVTCHSCGKLTHSEIDGCTGLDLCRKCYDEATQENHRNDNHEEDGTCLCGYC